MSEDHELAIVLCAAWTLSRQDEVHPADDPLPYPGVLADAVERLIAPGPMGRASFGDLNLPDGNDRFQQHCIEDALLVASACGFLKWWDGDRCVTLGARTALAIVQREGYDPGTLQQFGVDLREVIARLA